MTDRKEILKLLTASKVVAVVRLKDPEKAVPMTEALIRGGVSSIEITLTSTDAMNVIKELSSRFSDKGLIGVGSVVNVDQALESIENGAEFVVSPVTRSELIEIAHRYGKPAIIGAFTPTEILLAHEQGADLVKVFPAGKLGPGYFKDIHGPMPDIPLTPTGGIDLHNAADFIKAGAVCIGAGSSLVRNDFLAEGKWEQLSQLAAEFITAVNSE